MDRVSTGFRLAQIACDSWMRRRRPFHHGHQNNIALTVEEVLNSPPFRYLSILIVAPEREPSLSNSSRYSCLYLESTWSASHGNAQQQRRWRPFLRFLLLHLLWTLPLTISPLTTVTISGTISTIAKLLIALVLSWCAPLVASYDGTLCRRKDLLSGLQQSRRAS